jgi:hypothetical protein
MAFAFCYSLAEANIPSRVTTIDGNPYAGLDASKIKVDSANTKVKLTTINGALHLVSKDNKTVYGVYGATGDYTIGNGTTYYDYKMGALAGNDITSLTIEYKGTSYTTVNAYLAMHCTKLTSVTIPTNYTTINQYAFYNTALTTVALPSTITTINDYAFAYCADLDNVVIPAKTTKLGNYCFAYCTMLSDFAFEPYVNPPSSYTGVEIGTHFFYNCVNITEVILPERIKISNADFKNCLPSYNSINSMMAIPSYMFAGTGITVAEIDDSIHYFYTMGVFENCKNLTEVRIAYEYPSGKDGQNTLNTSMFDGCDNLNGNIIWEWVEEEA